MEVKKCLDSLTRKCVSLKFCRGLSLRGLSLIHRFGRRKHGERFQRVPWLFLLLLFLESLKVQSFGPVGLLLRSLLLGTCETSGTLIICKLLWPLVNMGKLLLLLLLLLQQLLLQSRELLLLLVTGRSKQLLLLRTEESSELLLL